MLPDDDNDPAQADNDAGQTKLGITVAAVPPQIAQKIGQKGGVIVTNVVPGSFAEEIGLGKGSIIIEINKKPVVGRGERIGQSWPGCTRKMMLSLWCGIRRVGRATTSISAELCRKRWSRNEKGASPYGGASFV